MKVVIPGGSGQVGRILVRGLRAAGHEVVVLSRRADPPHGIVAWDGRHLGDWVSELEGADAVVNLAGRSVNCRYHERNLREMMDSRLDSARVIGQAIAQCAHPPKVWLQASTATIYAQSFGPPHDESGELGGHEPDVPLYWARSTDIAKAWEATCLAAPVPDGVRRVLLRSSYIMSPDEGGIFDMLLWLARVGLGGPVRGGEQYISWIHEHDLVRAVLRLLEDDAFEGPVNLAAPNPIPQGQAMQALRARWGQGFGMPIAHWMAVLGAVYLRTDVELIEKSRCVVSSKLAEAGFEFEYPHWADAIDDLVERWPIAA